MKFPDSKILIFCKAPVAGKVKTRLTPDLTFDQAAELHKKLATETINLTIQSQLCPVEIWCSPDINHPFFHTFDLSLKQQQGMDLGERMRDAFENTLDTNSSTILIGTDCPSMTIHDLDLAITKLTEGSDVVIAPAEDGGYTLIGLNNFEANYRSIFENIDWGTSNVFDQTMRKIKALDLDVYKLPMQWDVDRPEDLQRYLDSKNNKH